MIEHTTLSAGAKPALITSTLKLYYSFINTPIYIFAVCLGAYILFTLIYWIQNKKLPFRKKQAVSKA